MHRSLLLLCATALTAVAQPAPIVSPDLRADHHVVFTLRAPKAQEVSLRSQWDKKTTPMTKDDAGTWTLDAGEVPAGVWEYSFIMDGLAMVDPSNPSLKPQRNPSSSILHVPGTPPNPWDFQDVPHGAVHRIDFQGSAAGRPREMWVYTPPGYESEGNVSYPLLVLQHGSGDNQKTWVEHGKMHWIMDNLIAAGKAKPMIVMMLDGHPLGQVPRDQPDRRAESLKAFQSELLNEALPLLQSRFQVALEREKHAITGLSMGGWQSLSIGLNHLDQFAWVGSFSGAVDEGEIKPALEDAAGTNAKLKLLWIACGKDDFLRERNESLVAKLKERGISHEWVMSEGDHSWPVWRNYLVEFVPKLFK